MWSTQNDRDGSGYSSQSETPTSSFPSAFFPGPLSPSSGKRKPKVPERKSSLSSLSLQSLSASKKDLELPIIPPSHLDLSALHGVDNKASAFRTQIQALSQNKHKAAVSAKPVAPPYAQVFHAHSMSITPTVLHSVQLKSIDKDHEGGQEDRTTSRLKCPTVNSNSTLSNSKSIDLKSPLFHNSHQQRSPTKGLCESMFTSNEELAFGEAAGQSEARMEQDGEAPLESVAAFSLQSKPSSDILERTDSPCRESAEAPVCYGDSSSHSQPSQQQSTERTDEEELCQPAPPLAVQHNSPKRSNSVDQVPATGSQSETLQESSVSNEGSTNVENESSGVSAQSASQDAKKEPTAETEESFSKGTLSFRYEHMNRHICGHVQLRLYTVHSHDTGTLPLFCLSQYKGVFVFRPFDCS